MDINLPLDQMTREEKLRALQAIQADLSRDENLEKKDPVESPKQHEDKGELRAGENTLKSVGELPAAWETAKTQLRDELL
jgi:hypothetical protein